MPKPTSKHYQGHFHSTTHVAVGFLLQETPHWGLYLCIWGRRFLSKRQVVSLAERSRSLFGWVRMAGESWGQKRLRAGRAPIANTRKQLAALLQGTVTTVLFLPLHS